MDSERGKQDERTGEEGDKMMDRKEGQFPRNEKIPGARGKGQILILKEDF